MYRESSMIQHVRCLGLLHVTNLNGAKVNERDGKVCLLSGMSDPDAAPIFPPALDERETLDLDTLLESFWGTTNALIWRSLYQNPAIAESITNHLSLQRQFSLGPGRARLALKPIGRTPTTITLQFHWLRETSCKPWDTTAGGPTPALDVASRLRDLGWGSDLAHRPSGVPIMTGQTYVVRAEKHEDLPSFELLELRWNMLRVAAICGAGEVDVDEHDG